MMKRKEEMLLYLLLYAYCPIALLAASPPITFTTTSTTSTTATTATSATTATIRLYYNTTLLLYYYTTVLL